MDEERYGEDIQNCGRGNEKEEGNSSDLILKEN